MRPEFLRNTHMRVYGAFGFIKEYHSYHADAHFRKILPIDVDELNEEEFKEFKEGVHFHGVYMEILKNHKRSIDDVIRGQIVTEEINLLLIP